MKWGVGLVVAFLLPGSKLFFPQSARAQGGEGNIFGHVKDAAGGVINGARTTVTSPATGLKRPVQSEADGTFSVINLPPGGYRMETSYAATAAQDVTVQVSQTLDLIGSLRGDPTFSWDTRIAKIFQFERLANSQLELLFEVFNLTNKANYGQNYNDNQASTNFRKPIHIITPPLQGQFGARFHF